MPSPTRLAWLFNLDGNWRCLPSNAPRLRRAYLTVGVRQGLARWPPRRVVDALRSLRDAVRRD